MSASDVVPMNAYGCAAEFNDASSATAHETCMDGPTTCGSWSSQSNQPPVPVKCHHLKLVSTFQELISGICLEQKPISTGQDSMQFIENRLLTAVTQIADAGLGFRYMGCQAQTDPQSPAGCRASDDKGSDVATAASTQSLLAFYTAPEVLMARCGYGAGGSSRPLSISELQIADAASSPAPKPAAEPACRAGTDPRDRPGIQTVLSELNAIEARVRNVAKAARGGGGGGTARRLLFPSSDAAAYNEAGRLYQPARSPASIYIYQTERDQPQMESPPTPANEPGCAMGSSEPYIAAGRFRPVNPQVRCQGGDDGGGCDWERRNKERCCGDIGGGDCAGIGHLIVGGMETTTTVTAEPPLPYSLRLQPDSADLLPGLLYGQGPRYEFGYDSQSRFSAVREASLGGHGFESCMLAGLAGHVILDLDCFQGQRFVL
ncbi:hypothetical protein VOLCADRAFT_102908 [Volvox carteri f. nagariensis]|uniref:Uncharacterized protein n=1 Tax=Volvox carteri f. nagariensis TaxID=3068 RepID=D8TIT8_VOLCA|nr:uncharacterized protein VOLCADRAFT_102908 [Volvox carteri f. nagariensis]EFJ53301.1 hypothetical protein VOLCADRAFT_102908 [Volvox carteri f. nagariensis]|eukprot:XP_002946306.1 hypothetical protein VOLCADRAFT_102908 [Volvox carteri f. nagariensis]